MCEKIVVTVDADLEDIVPIFLSTKEKDIQKMKDALAEGDYETIRLAGHSLKGSGSGYGFDTISDIGKCIEKAAVEKNDTVIAESIVTLASFLERVEVVYES